MAKNDPKSRGGGGFKYEDQVTAYFATYLLCGNTLFPDLNIGNLERIEFQRNSDGWELDDCILVFSKNTTEHRIALSLKSNTQFTSEKAPGTLVESIWKQHLKSEPNPFAPTTDHLGIVTEALTGLAKSTLTTLLKQAKSHNEQLGTVILKEGFTNEKVRNLYTSFECPSTYANNSKKTTGEVLALLLHLDYEFNSTDSIPLKLAHDNLKKCLYRGDVKTLWNTIQILCRDTRETAGSLSYKRIIDKLKDTFHFRGWEQLENDLYKLDEHSKDYCNNISESFQNKVSLLNLPSSLNAIKSNFVNVLIGPSGIGKSSLLKQWYYQNKNSRLIVMLPYSAFNKTSIEDVSTHLGLNFSLKMIIEKGPSSQTYIIDGLDRINSETSYQLLKTFFLTVIEAGHQVITTSQDRIWPSQLLKLHSNSFQYHTIEKSKLSNDDLDFIQRNFKEANYFLKDSRLKELAKSPKYLDLLFKISNSQTNSSKPILGETSLIEAFWEHYITVFDTDHTKAFSVMKLAVLQADEKIFSTPITKLSSVLKTLSEVPKDIITTNSQGTYQFVHDIYGDWARMKFLLADEHNVSTLIEEKKANIYWHQAIRLLSLYYIESSNIDKWQTLVDKFSNEGNELALDVLFDVALISIDQKEVLNSISNYLLKNKCQQLSRLLKRFLINSTIPAQKILDLAVSLGINEIEASQHHRIPIVRYWPPMLLFLLENIEKIEGCYSQICETASKWMESTPKNFPFRKECAQLLLNRVELLIKENANGILSMGDIEKECFRYFMKAFEELPKECESVLSILAGQTKNPYRIDKDSSGKSSHYNMFYQKIEPIVYEHGPVYPVERDFQTICLESNTLIPVIINNPELARKILLSCMIEVPPEYERIGERIDESYGLAYDNGKFYPPFYDKGPFLNFLINNPKEGINAIIYLVNHVTKHWVIDRAKWNDGFKGLELSLNGTTKFWEGDQQVYFWSDDCPHCPNSVVSALMALEKWLYQQIDAGNDVEDYISDILDSSTSLAIIGVLSSVAKKKPILLCTKLKELFSDYHLLLWEELHLTQRSLNLFGISWHGEQRDRQEEAVAWFQAEHKKNSLKAWMFTFFFNDEPMKEFITQVVARWSQIPVDQMSDFLKNLIPQFNLDNYKISSDGQHTFFKYTPPEALRIENEPFMREHALRMKLLTFTYTIDKFFEAPETIKPDTIKSTEATLKEISPLFQGEEHVSTYEDCLVALITLTVFAHSRGIISLTVGEFNKHQETLIEFAKKAPSERRFLQNPASVFTGHYDSYLGKLLGKTFNLYSTKAWFNEIALHLLKGCRVQPMKDFFSSTENPNNVLKYIPYFNFLFSVSYLNSLNKYLGHFLEYGHHGAPVQKKNLTKARKLVKENSKTLQMIQDSFETKEQPWLHTSPVDPKVILVNQYRYFTPDLEDYFKCIGNMPPLNKWPVQALKGWNELVISLTKELAYRLEHSRSTSENGRIDGAPYGEDNHLLYLAANTYFWVSKMDDKRIWLPLYQVGPEAHYWLDDFASDFFSEGINNQSESENFISKLIYLFETIQQIDSWKSRRHDASKIWCSFLGLESSAHLRLTEENCDFALKILKVYERWLTINSSNAECIGKFANLLSLKYSKKIRTKLFCQMMPLIESEDLGSYYNRWNMDYFSSLLTVLWIDHRDDMKNNSELKNCFNLLLSKLLPSNQPKVIEISNQFKYLR